MSSARVVRASVGIACSFVLAGCRGHGAKPDDVAPAPSVVASALPVPSELTTLPAGVAAADLRVEARRGVVTAPDPLLARHRKELTEHFGTPVPYPLAFQVAAIGAGRVAVLLQATHGDARPLVWLLDGNGEIFWAKKYPIGGVRPGVTEATIAPGPDGHVCLAWCNGSTDSIAFRRWAEDGGAFADYDALHVDACDALSVLYWPGHGWVLGTAFRGGAILELLDENGERKWGNDGLSLPWTWPTAAPLSFALDTQDSLMLFRLGQSGGAGSAEYVFASRWSPDGRPMWPGPLSLVRLAANVSDTLSRVALAPSAEGTIRAMLPPSAAPGPGVVVEVGSDGAVTRR